MYFVLGGRGRPNLALGRLVAQGRVSELTIDDLRFTLSEIEDLFSDAYGQPLDEEPVASSPNGPRAGPQAFSWCLPRSQ